MRNRTLGNTGVKVSELCLGAMMFGAMGNRDHDDSVAIIHRALDAGINFIDTADVYSRGESETIVGKALAGRRDDVVLATKFHGAMGEGPNLSGNSRRWIVREVEDSLRRLGTDWIDLYQVHRPDPSTDIEDTLGALDDLVHAGKIRYAGCSTFPAELIVEAHWAADRRGFERVPHRAAAVLDLRPQDRERPAADVRALRHGRARVEPAERRLADRPLRARATSRATGRMERMPQRFDLDAARQPAQAGAARRARRRWPPTPARTSSAWRSASCSPTRR